jgi:uncharacterized membrane protein YfcA
MTLSLAQGALAGASGGLVGFVLALLGGGGSILATPLLLFVVGVPNPHVAIGTSAVAVSVNALASLATHAGAGTVKWRCAGLFAATGVVGALIGSTIGKAMDGEKLMAIFALLMIAIGLLSLRRKGFEGDPGVRLSSHNAPLLAALGFAAGLVSGFFGIGGGFLIAPGLIAATGMPMIYAVGSSLVSVAAFGAATAFNYALSGSVDWPLALAFVAGGALGALGGARAGRSLSGKKGALDVIFACAIILTGSWMLYQSVRFVF